MGLSVGFSVSCSLLRSDRLLDLQVHVVPLQRLSKALSYPGHRMGMLIISCCAVAQSSQTLCDPMEPARLSCPCGSSRQEYWSGLLCPLPVWDALVETRPQSGKYHEETDMIPLRQMWLRTRFLAQASLLYDDEEEWLSQQEWVLAGAVGRHWEGKAWEGREAIPRQNIMKEKEHSKSKLLL